MIPKKDGNLIGGLRFYSLSETPEISNFGVIASPAWGTIAEQTVVLQQNGRTIDTLNLGCF